MAIKIARGADRNFAIKIYDPEIAKVITIKSSSSESLRSLQVEHLIPNLRQYYASNRPIGVMVNWPEQRYCAKKTHYIDTGDVINNAELLGNALCFNQFETLSWLIQSIKSGSSKAAVKDAFASPALNNDWGTLGSLITSDTSTKHQMNAMLEMFDLMKWSGLNATKAAEYINRRRVVIDGHSLPYRFLDQGKPIEVFLDGCQNLGIKGRLLIDCLGIPTNTGETPLMACLATGDSKNLDKLLKRLPDFEVNLNDFVDLLGKGRFGDKLTAAHFMLNFGHAEAVDLLFEGLAKLGVSKGQFTNLLGQFDSNGLTPIGHALLRGQKETLTNVFKHFPTFGVIGDEAFNLITKDSALLKACKGGDTAMLGILLEALPRLGINPTRLLEVKDSEGNNMVDIAEREGHQNLKKLLVDHGVVDQS